ncbi:MAG: PLP-dependent aminotransferase family protein [Chloroflexi bacterium]|nr:PLP-dependent aminotransferase family protein [Chloroflexota bacterium]
MTSKSTFDGTVTTNWDERFAERTQNMMSSIIREILKLALQPDIISFAGGMPASELFLVREFGEACQYVLSHDGVRALQYGTTEGYPPLKQYLVEKMQEYDVPAEQENILIVNGSQQALDLIGKMFITPGDLVLTEGPTYLGAIQAFRAYQARFVTVPLDEDGIRTDKLEQALERHPVKFIYVLPNFHNPAGVTMTLERRLKLVELAARYGVFIVEDDPYGELRFEGEDVVPLVVLHKENVLYLSTFSKTLSPGIRLGWIVAPSKIIAKLVQAKQGADLHTSTFIQMVAHDICQRGILRHHAKDIRKVYKERRDAMLAAMEKHFPSGVTWTRPQGGLFLWVQLPEHVDAAEFLNVALQEKVAFVPGRAFYPDEGGKNAMRLTFATAGPEKIEEGIKRLGRALMRELG